MAWALTQWSFDPVPVIGCVVAAVLYTLGRRTPGNAARSRATALSFWSGLLLVAAALISPLDGLDLRWQWVHMTQHVLLLLAAPPLLLLGDAFGTMWRGVQALGSGSTAPPRVITRALLWLRGTRAGSLLTLLLFCADLLAWHIPALYNLTLENQGVHVVEHLCFLVTGLLYWDQVVTPLQGVSAQALGRRAAFVLAAMTVSWVLAIVIGYAGGPLYAYPQASSGISLLQDQQIAAGIMWVPGSIPFVVALIGLLIAWFELEDRQGDAVSADVR